MRILIQPQELASILDGQDIVILDCRFALADSSWGKNSYEEAHIPGALYAHLNEDLSAEHVPGSTGRHPLPDVEFFQNKMRFWGIDKGTKVVVYDQSTGAIAARAWWLLKWMGYGTAQVLDGGWKGWNEMSLPVTSEIPSPQRSEFEANVRYDLLITAEEAFELAQRSDKLLIDARSNERYRGDNEPIDPVAGHIPGAINIPFAGNVDVSGKWRSQNELQKRFEQLEGVSSDSFGLYCGSGVTGCHDLIAIEIAGHGEGKLYAGSWSDWITDQDRPIEGNG